MSDDGSRILRDDMLELTRRMNRSRSGLIRAAGCYIDEDGCIDGTFNTSFLGLSPSVKDRVLAMAKTIPFSETNRQLRSFSIPGSGPEARELYQLLEGLRTSGLRNDALADLFYERAAGIPFCPGPGCVYLVYGCYDVRRKASDGSDLGESEEVYDFLICACAPWSGDYQPGTPCWGFLYPAFSQRGRDLYHIYVYEQVPGTLTPLRAELLGIPEPPAAL